MLTIRHITDQDQLWAILKPVFQAGETYPIDPNITREDALAYWCAPHHQTFVAIEGDEVLGTYYLRPNHQGNGDHICNCGYMTHPEARGRGIARAMLEHSLSEAKARGYMAMQYNLVIANNHRAVATWTKNGFEEIGRIPDAFNHPKDGLVDALILFRRL